MKPMADGIGSAGERDGQEVLSLCYLTAGERLFGIDTRSIREVLGTARLSRVPMAPAYVAGVIAYRGEVITAISLRALLGFENAATPSCVLVLDGDEDEQQFGLAIDRVGGVAMVERGTMATNPSTLDDASRALFAGSFRTANGLLVQLTPEQLRPSQLAQSGLFGNAERTRLERVLKTEGEMR
jgi:purine-binding chemotaxis protein CheW